ncbi:MAG: transcription elongation factor GreA [Anaerolineaceae bacterium]|nr:transcription elongation factor GreA [Anaerolineaceae bacterium]
MTSERITLTRAGYQRLSNELAKLEELQRGEIEEVAEAFDDTDFGENAVFYDAVFDKDRLTAQIENLKHVLARAEVIDEDPDPTRVSPGNRVTVFDVDEREEITFRIISAEEVTHGIEGISNESPVGSALLGHQVGDVVEIKVPDGLVHYTIRRIE